MNVYEVALDNEQFEEFIRCLSILKDHCVDCDIRDGIVRQRSNDKSVIFEVDLTPIISNVSLPIQNLKQKIDLLKIFLDNQVDILVQNDNFIIRDNYSSINILKPRLDFLDNQFMPEEELNNLFDLQEEDLILNVEISNTISDRIRIISQGFNINSLQVNLDGEYATISAETASKDQKAKFLSNLLTNKEVSATTNLVSIPFTSDHDGSIEFKMFNTRDNIAISRFNSSISEVDINMFSRSILIESENTKEDLRELIATSNKKSEKDDDDSFSLDDIDL